MPPFEPNPHNPTPTPEELELQATLDLLVDDELPETPRAHLLRTIDAQPQRWRELALRFLDRQTERTAVRQLMGQNTAPAHAKTFPFPSPAPRRHWNTYARAAAVLLIAILSGLTGAYWPWRNPTPSNPPPPLAQTATVQLPLSVAGTPNPVTVQVPIVDQKKTTDSDLLASSLVADENDSSQHVVFAPQGQNRVLMFVVSRRNDETLY